MFVRFILLTQPELSARVATGVELDAITIYDAQLRRHTVRTYKSTKIDNMNLPLWEEAIWVGSE